MNGWVTLRPRAHRAGERLSGPILAIVLVAVGQAASGQSMKAEVSSLSDVQFGTIETLQVDQRRSQSVCVASNSNASRYSLLASGNGAGGAFELRNGNAILPYTVEWNDTPGQTSGVSVAPNQPLAGLSTVEKGPRCKRGPTATLTLVLAAAELSGAEQGDYSGALTLLIAPE